MRRGVQRITGIMSQVKLDLRGKTVSQKLTLAQTVITQSTNNPNLPDANPATVVTLNAKRYTLQVCQANSAAKKQDLATATEALDAAEKEFDTAFGQHGAYVQDRTGGVATSISSTGLGVADESHTPTALTAPQHYDVSLGDEAGELHADWDPVPGSKGYETEVTTDLTGATGWGNRKYSSKSDLDIKNLTSGTTYLVRTRSVGSDNREGPWSQTVQRRAP